MSEYCDHLIQFESFGEVECDEPTGIINWLCETGKAGRFAHNVENRASQWDKLCALEDALVDSRVNEGFTFVVGSMKDDPEVHGWLEYEDVILVPYGPKRQESGSDVGVYSRGLFDASEYIVHALAPAADDSAIQLNKIIRERTGKPISPTGVVG